MATPFDIACIKEGMFAIHDHDLRYFLCSDNLWRHYKDVGDPDLADLYYYTSREDAEVQLASWLKYQTSRLERDKQDLLAAEADDQDVIVEETDAQRQAEKIRKKQLAQLKAIKERLNNPVFAANAPPDVLERQQRRMEELEEQLGR
jgi:hypothetical protein